MPVTHEYWFARRFPIGHPKTAFGPVHWKGWTLAAVRVLLLCGGGALFAWFATHDHLIEGVAYFVLVSLVATVWFLLVVRANADQVHTIEDYKEGRVSV